jgi:hypothetical protein
VDLRGSEVTNQTELCPLATSAPFFSSDVCCPIAKESKDNVQKQESSIQSSKNQF